MVHMTVTFAREYLRRVRNKVGERDMHKVALRRLEEPSCVAEVLSSTATRLISIWDSVSQAYPN